MCVRERERENEYDDVCKCECVSARVCEGIRFIHTNLDQGLQSGVAEVEVAAHGVQLTIFEFFENVLDVFRPENLGG